MARRQRSPLALGRMVQGHASQNCINTRRFIDTHEPCLPHEVRQQAFDVVRGRFESVQHLDHEKARTQEKVRLPAPVRGMQLAGWLEDAVNLLQRSQFRLPLEVVEEIAGSGGRTWKR